MDSTLKVIGIDFGEEKCSVAVVVSGQPEVILNEYGERLTPTCIHFEHDSVRVGKAALECSVENPSNTVVGIKSLIGKQFVDLQKTEKSAFCIVDKDGTPHVEIFAEELEDDAFHVYHGSYTAEQLVTIILRNLKETAETFFNKDQTTEQKIAAVIAVPAHFGINERRVMIEAGRMAGLDILGLINETTAAAVAYRLNKKTSGKLLVYDFGARSVQASVVQTGNGNQVDVLGFSYHDSLGGEEIDCRLTNHLLNVLCAKNNLCDVADIEKVRARLRPRVRDAKRNLTDGRSHSHIVVPYQDKALSAVLTKEHLEVVCRDLYQSVLEPIKKALDYAGTTIDQIGQIVMVGGGSRLRAIRPLIQEQFGITSLSRDINPEEAVANGAAVFASALVNAAQTMQVQVSDILTQGIGIRHSNGTIEMLFTMASKLPAVIEKTFQDSMDLTIVESNSLEGGNDRFVERLTVDTSDTGTEVTDIAVCFRCDQSGLLTVTATDVASGDVLIINKSLQRQGSEDNFEHVSHTDGYHTTF